MKALFIESVDFHHGCHIQPLARPKSDKLFFRAAIEAVAVSQFVLIHSVRLLVVSLALRPSSHICHKICSCAYLSLLIILPEILIPACVSSSPAFFMMHSAYKLNRWGNNIQL